MRGLYLVLAAILMIGNCLSDTENICSSWTKASVHVNVTSDDLPVKLSLHHNFLLTKNGIVPGLRYNVSLQNVGDGVQQIVLKTESFAKFEKTANVGTCGLSSDMIVESLVHNMTNEIETFHNLNTSLMFTLAVREKGSEVWYTATYEFPLRSECYFFTPKEDISLPFEDLELQGFSSLLIQAPQTSALEIKMEDVILQEEGTILIYNTSESSQAVALSFAKQEDLRFLIFGYHLLLIDTKRCQACKFRIVVKQIAVEYVCNSTLRISKGSLKLAKQSPPSACELYLQAKPHQKIILKVTDMSSITSDSCHHQMLALEPLDGVPKQKIWTPCYNESRKQKEFYISETNVLKVSWSGGMEDILLNYEFLLPCSNRIYGESPIGHFCSTGYPDILFGCNQAYSIYVPLGYTIDLKLNVLGLKSGAFCLNNTLNVVTRDESKVEKLLLGLCLSLADEQDEVFTLKTSGNFIDFRIRSPSDLHRKGFCASYKAIPSDSTLLDACPYGWTSGQKFCYKVFDERLTWSQAEDACQTRNGHLASITDNRVAVLIDEVIRNSPIFAKSNAFWIGANDLRYENCYEWTDGQPFDFYHWFPGWENYGGYSVQPSDDGLSQQNCVELRNLFRYPSKGEGITDRFFWNDRDCYVSNPSVCQRLKPGVNIDPVTVPACNRTIVLSLEHTHEVLTSPGYPNNYPNSIECHYYITAPKGQKIVALFTDFIVEESDSCEYDVLTITDEDAKWYRCGDWKNKIKLLRHISHRQSLSMTFSSDFSHSFKGFRIELSILAERTKQSTLCDNDMFQLKGGKCYLVVNYPETSWGTARQICSEAKAQLAIVENVDQVAVLDELVRSNYGYMFGIIYWVGAYSTAKNGTWKWLDGSLLNPKHMHVSKMDDSQSCLAIQWKQLRSANALRWISKNCNHPGRFICQKPSVVVPDELNATVSQLKGNLTSVNFPSNYLNDLDYRVEMIGPPNSRVVITFHHFELEWQEDCLYDYVLLQSNVNEKGLKICGEYIADREFVSTTNRAYLSFHSDFSISTSGYDASWEIVDLSGCLNRRLLILEPTSITSLRYPRAYLTDIECRLTAIASEPTKRLLITIRDLDLRPCSLDFLEINLDPEDTKKINLCDMDFIPGVQFMAYGNEAEILFHSAQENSTTNISNRGYNFTCETWAGTSLSNTIYLDENKKGKMYGMNTIHQQPIGLNYSQRIVAKVGYKIHLRSLNISLPTLRKRSISCDGSGLVIRDKYALQPILISWTPCQATNLEESNGFWSTLNVLNIVAWNFDGHLPPYYLEYTTIKDDHFKNTTQALTSHSIESCRPNPCQHGGRCITNGTNNRCHCFGQYTGLFCHLTWCDVNVCGENGFCNLTTNGWTCDCNVGFTGNRCQKTVTPCFPNPCGENGVCSPRNDTYLCRCALDFEGPRCEKLVMRIPYKPLSERMLEEPFWLGLITVFTVLLIILLVYCIKRKFADKIEKFLAEEIERSKYQPSPPATRYSLSSTQPSLTPGNQSPQTCPKSLFNRIRKNSILSTACSPSPTPDRDASRTFSFDDILRRVHSSKRTKGPSNNSSCSAGPSSLNQTELSREEASKKEDEKSRILASLVTPQKEAASRRMSLDEFFRMSERKLQLSARRTNSSADSTESKDGKKETSFINEPSPKTLRQSFLEIQSIQEQSFEYMSSSESMNDEPSTSEVQADVSPTPPACKLNPNDSEEEEEEEPEEKVTTDNSTLPPHSNPSSSAPSDNATPPSISIKIDNCDSDNKPDSEPNETNCDNVTKSHSCNKFTALSPILPRNSSYLEVPKTIPAIQVFSAESDEPESNSETISCNFTQERSESTSPCRKDFIHGRKYSVDLPMPKILITSNMGSCDSDEASPPRTPNPNKSMMYLSPLAVISTDRTISESNLSTSGYSSISSPGLSRCNSSSPISDDVEHHHHPNCSHNRNELQSPKKTHGVQMTYLSVAGNDKTFFFPQTIACHCHTANPSPPFEPKTSPSVSAVWTPGKHRLLCKRSSYQTTSTDDSIDDEGIGMDPGEFKMRKAEVRSPWDSFSGATEQATPHVPLLMEPTKPDLLACSINSSKSGSGKGSPRAGLRKGDKPNKYADKKRRSPVLSPASTPLKDHSDNTGIPRNSSRTSMSGPLMSSSESDESEGYLGTRQKSQTRRSKKHETVVSGHKQPLVSMPSQDSSGPKSSDATGRSSPMSESNGDSAPLDSRSPASSSSESLSSTREPRMSEKILDKRHKITLEHTRSFPPLGSKNSRADENVGAIPKIKIDLKRKSPVIQIDDEVIRPSEDHPHLRRQEAIIEDDSDDSSSETTVLLGRQTESPRNLQQSSSADISEWEAFNKE